jgi:hypothetical protein
LFSHFAYGLNIYSALLLPELAPGKGAADVHIRLGNVARSPSEAAAGCFRAPTGEMIFFWEGVGTFLVRGGCEIVVDPAPEVDERVLRPFILGAVLAMLLHQRGRLVLHASAVAVDGAAVAFLGASGWGKSTMAAALHARGHRVVADDMVAVQEGAGCPAVFPGFPQLKLWPEAAISLGDDVKRLPRLHPLLDKRIRRVTDGFSQNPLPLRQIYVLAEGKTQEVEPLRLQEALIELVRHSYLINLLRPLGEASSHFLQCASLAKNVSIYRLKRPHSLRGLSDLARMVEEDLADNALNIAQ